MADSEDRTESPTARRLEQSRAEGRVALSRDLVVFATLVAAVALARSRSGPAIEWLVGRLAAVLDRAGEIGPVDGLAIGLLPAAFVVAPLALVCLIGAYATTVLQTRQWFNLSLLSPRWERLNPAARLKQMFGPHGIKEALRSLLKVGGVLAAAWWAASSRIGDIAELSLRPALASAQVARDLSMRVAWAVIAAFLVFALADVGQTMWQHWRGLRMSRNEVRDEHKEQEGDPLIKRRVRQMMQSRARRRMMAAIPDATVVLMNPTHYAVALAYDRSRGAAPRVVAKGVDEVALRIRDMAEQHRVPVVVNPPLARALYKVELDEEIPAEHYRLVAEVIAYVWRLKTGIGARRAAAP